SATTKEVAIRDRRLAASWGVGGMGLGSKGPRSNIRTRCVPRRFAAFAAPSGGDGGRVTPAPALMVARGLATFRLAHGARGQSALTPPGAIATKPAHSRFPCGPGSLAQLVEQRAFNP